MNDPRGNVRPGDPLRIAAEQINFLNRLMAADTSYGGGPLQNWAFGGNILLVKNTTASTVDRWGVIKIAGIEIDPNEDDSARRSFESMPCVRGEAAENGGTTACVALEPIKAGKIGRAAVDGVVQIKAADKGKVGGSFVLWEDGDWALIRLGGGGVRLGKTTAVWTKGTLATIELYEQGTPPNETRNTTNYTLANCVNKFATVASGKWVAVAQMTNGRWYLIAAEC